MKRIQLFSVVFSLIMFTSISTGTAIAFAESEDDDQDFDDRLEYFCEMTGEEKEQLFMDHPRLAQFEERLANFCNLDEKEREDLIEELIEEHFPNYEEKNDWDMVDILDRYCEMSDEDKAALLEKHPMASDHQEKMEEYCLLEETERDAYIEENKDEYLRDHDSMKFDYNIREKLNEFCEMSDEDKLAHNEKLQKNEEHLEEMEKYCALDEAGKDMFIEEHMMEMKREMSDHKDSMPGKMSDHKDSMTGKMSDHKDSIISDRKSHMILRASTLTDEQKNEIKVLHDELRDFKHSLRDKSISDLEKQEIRDHFMEKAKEFSMTWISPRHQVAAGIDANQVECREGFTLVMKTSNATPICVKETTAEKLIERGIVISSI